MTNLERYEKVTGLIRAKAKEILPEGSTVTLFGSRARGDAREDSGWEKRKCVLLYYNIREEGKILYDSAGR